MAGASPSSAGSSSWWVRSVRVGGRKRARTQLLEENRPFIHNNKTNKQKLPRRGKTNWLASRQGWTGQGWTGQGRTGHRRHLTLGNEPTRNCKHKEIIKGANGEGNEGKQLGKINQ